MTKEEVVFASSVGNTVFCHQLLFGTASKMMISFQQKIQLDFFLLFLLECYLICHGTQTTDTDYFNVIVIAIADEISLDDLELEMRSNVQMPTKALKVFSIDEIDGFSLLWKSSIRKIKEFLFLYSLEDENAFQIFSLFPIDKPCQCGIANSKKNEDVQAYIINGQETKRNEFPWQVALVKAGFHNPFCGGSIISDKHILTAAHCTEELSLVQVRKENTTQEKVTNFSIEAFFW